MPLLRRLATLAAARPAPLVLLQQSGASLHPASLAALAVALQLGNPVTALVAAADTGPLVAAARAAGVRSVLTAQHAAFATLNLSAPLSALLVALLAPPSSYTHLLAGHTNAGRDLVARVAGLLGVPPLSGVQGVSDGTLFTRGVYSGSLLATLRCTGPPPHVLTVAPTATHQVLPEPGDCTVTPVPEPALAAAIAAAAASRTIALPPPAAAAGSAAARQAAALTAAASVVCGGRGVRDAAGFAQLADLAALLPRGAVGGTRVVCDAGLLPHEVQVGQTGHILRPELYFGVGVSGAIQHLAGLRGARTVVSINKDPGAPLSGAADVVWTADAAAAVPALIEALQQ